MMRHNLIPDKGASTQFPCAFQAIWNEIETERPNMECNYCHNLIIEYLLVTGENGTVAVFKRPHSSNFQKLLFKVHTIHHQRISN